MGRGEDCPCLISLSFTMSRTGDTLSPTVHMKQPHCTLREKQDRKKRTEDNLKVLDDSSLIQSNEHRQFKMKWSQNINMMPSVTIDAECAGYILKQCSTLTPEKGDGLKKKKQEKKIMMPWKEQKSWDSDWEKKWKAVFTQHIKSNVI